LLGNSIKGIGFEKLCFLPVVGGLLFFCGVWRPPLLIRRVSPPPLPSPAIKSVIILLILVDYKDYH